MENKELLIGSHVSMNGPEFYYGSVKEALSYGANIFMFYTGAPQNSFRKPLNELRIEEGRALIKENGIDESKIVVHAPYIINPGNIQNEVLYEQTIKTLLNEVVRTAGFGAHILVLHPGAHVGQGKEIAIKAVSKALDMVLANDHTDVKIALETMAGKGSEIGTDFNEIKEIISLCEHKDRLGVCLDTCHISDAGYDINDFDKILDDFSNIVGLDYLKCIHVNDSMNPISSHKDRHANIGYGTIGFDTLINIVYNKRLEGLPFILETPYINRNESNEYAPYKMEIESIRNKKYVDFISKNKDFILLNYL